MELLTLVLILIIALASILTKKHSSATILHILIIFLMSVLLFLAGLPYVGFFNLIFFTTSTLFIKLHYSNSRNIFSVEYEYRKSILLKYFFLISMFLLLGVITIIIFNNSEYMLLSMGLNESIRLDIKEKVFGFILPQVMILIFSVLVLAYTKKETKKERV